jgi:hypothetical protein
LNKIDTALLVITITITWAVCIYNIRQSTEPLPPAQPAKIYNLKVNVLEDGPFQCRQLVISCWGGEHDYRWMFDDTALAWYHENGDENE